MTRYRLGIDIGGTFTDGSLVDENTGAVSIIKVLTTPSNPADGFMEAVGRVREQADFTPDALNMLVHATTIATNAIIEGNTARLAMVTTEGFRDVLEIGYQIRPRLYDIFQAKPKPLVERRWSFGVPERLDARGEVLKPLDEPALRDAVRKMKAGGVEAVVVCFLHSYINPVHEKRAAEIIREEFPEAYLSVSSEVCPEFREFPRASTAAVNAAVMPVVARYVDDLESRLKALEITAPFYIMQSNGGVMSAQSAKVKPVYMVESGPAAGVISAAALARSMGYDNVISFDMGGTTAKVGMIRGGEPTLSNEYEVGSQAHSPLGEGKGSGYPVRTPVIDLVEVGAGGGSLAWIDAGGSLRVGPRSAGADPGPVCYGRGGVNPALTDANLILGRLDPGFFLGGEMALDPEGARRAMEEKIAAPLGLDAMSSAAGVVDIANAGMIAAMRLVSVQRGYDPRDFALVAFGGAGPLHAGALAEELDMPTLIIPTSPGVASSVGLLMTDIRHEFVITSRVLLNDSDPRELTETYRAYEEQAAALLENERDDWAETALVRTLDLRYRGQSHELQVEVPGGALGSAELERTQQLFEATHTRAYGYAATEDPIELVNLRLTAVGRLPKLARKKLLPGTGDVSSALKGTRQVWLRQKQSGHAKAMEPKAVETPVYDRYKLKAGDTFPGPAIVEEMDSTTVVPADYSVGVDEYGNLVISRN